MPPAFQDSLHASSGSQSEDGIDEDALEHKIRNIHCFDRPEPVAVPRNYNVVSRLSRWEGGNVYDKQLFTANKLARGGFEEQEQEDRVENGETTGTNALSLSLSDVVRVFRRSDAMLEVNNEDIERVKIMHERFLEGSKFSFNYNVLLLIASILAALGLGSNSVATIIASMLVSPLMGPVVGMAYASTIYDYKMFRIGFVTEVVSLLVCIVTGVVVAACMLPFQVTDDWPTPEMYNRGSITSFWVGFPVAFFSGLGVAVSLLDDQTSSLVGVAISASLLPPAVNSGMFCVSYYAYDPTSHSFSDDWNMQDFRTMGVLSLGLTLINIVLIIISSMIMFRLKERLPIQKSIFWSDLGVARKIYRNLAVIPRVQRGPTPEDLNDRVSQLLSPRVNTAGSGSAVKRAEKSIPHGSEDQLTIIDEQVPVSGMPIILEDSGEEKA